MADDDFVPDADFVADAPARKSKYPDPKSFSAPDAPDTGAIKTRRVPGTSINFVEKPEALTPAAVAAQDRERLADVNKTVSDLAVSGGAAGGLKSSLANALTKPAAAAGTTTDLIKKAIASTVHHWAEKVMGETGSQIAGQLASRAGATVGSAAPAARAVGANLASAAAGEVAPSTVPPAVPAAEPAPFKGVMTNAIEKLRAAAVGDARARELLQRIEAAQNTPSGTVSQGTLGGGH